MNKIWYLTYPFSSADQVKELATGGKLNNHENIRGRVDKLIVLDDVRVVE